VPGFCRASEQMAGGRATPGEALTVPAGVVHAVRNTGTGTGTATELATYVVETGKPLLTVAQ